MRIKEEVTEEVTKTKEIGFVCCFCGQEHRYTGKYPFYPNDGFTFTYRDSEEDEICIEAREMCDDCMFERIDEVQGKVIIAVKALRDLAPYARVTARMWGNLLGPVDEDDE